MTVEQIELRKILSQKLADGYIVVMANPFDAKGKQGMEYILEKKN